MGIITKFIGLLAVIINSFGLIYYYYTRDEREDSLHKKDDVFFVRGAYFMSIVCGVALFVMPINKNIIPYLFKLFNENTIFFFIGFILIIVGLIFFIKGILHVKRKNIDFKDIEKTDIQIFIFEGSLALIIIGLFVLLYKYLEQL